ncbi:LOW QUALITY PROTEIN: replication protein A 32 kDa subunit-like [Macrobrachium nipponense]|uniref:LOW QUALITY PROTEIN: replication protein A 32 kDa subunit-like n=1 Tax=Macrobrachium nipponense TaxID=159736 RepID=UPI0030C8BA1E
MWNSGGGGFDGGFMSTQQDFASPAGQSEKKARRSQNLIPVTLKAVMDSTDDTLRVSNTEVHMLSVVGLIKAVDVTSTKTTYKIDDTTAVMDAVQWVENSFSKPLIEMTYCQIFGSVRTQAGNKYIMIFRIMHIEDPNLITTHMLEVIHSYLKLQQIEKLQAGGMASNSAGNTGMMDNSLVGTTGLGGGMNTGMGSGGFSGMHGLNTSQNMVFQVLRQCTDESGVEREFIFQQLSGKLSKTQINQELDFLSSEGHIYTTIDEDHFKTTDG